MNAKLLDLLGFLIGVRGSIIRLTHGRGAFPLAALLVATAAMAREYDAVSWWHHPGDLLAPFGASVVLSSILFVWLWAALNSARVKLKSLGRQFLVFLTGYWLTAPLAWLYAVPIESLTDELSAIRFNLTALSIVSIWRVLLFSRIVSIQFRLPMLAVLLLVLVPCMAVAFVALLNAQLSIVSIMGGIRLTEAEKLVTGFQTAVLAGIFYSFIPIVLLNIAVLVALRKKNNGPIRCRELRPISPWLWSVPFVASIVLIYGASLYQPKFVNAERVDELLRQGQWDEAIRQMESLCPTSFPVSWEPPPSVRNGDVDAVPIEEIARSIERSMPPVWVGDVLLRQADDLLLQQAGLWHMVGRDDAAEVEPITLPPDELQMLRERIQQVIFIELSDVKLKRRLKNLLDRL